MFELKTFAIAQAATWATKEAFTHDRCTSFDEPLLYEIPWVDRGLENAR